MTAAAAGSVWMRNVRTPKRETDVNHHMNRLQIAMSSLCAAASGFLSLSAIAPSTESPAIDLALARQYFDEAGALAEHDGGAFWGKSLGGPMLFVDPQSRFIVANQADRGGALTEEEGVFTGTLPAAINIGNTAVNFSGVDWSMLIWPLPEDARERGTLMMHESFHRIQKDVGFPMSVRTNAHLDSADGRTWLRLEWRALADALDAENPLESEALRDALIFRERRRQLSRTGLDEERAVEFNEGLAEYTGVRLGGYDESEAIQRTVRQLLAYERMSGFTQSFAYATGPAWGLLLDRADPDWRKSIDQDLDLAQHLRRAAQITLPPNLATTAQERAIEYDGEELIAQEKEREAVRAKRHAELHEMFITRPTLRISLDGHTNFSYNPHGIEIMDGIGKVYASMRITGVWGILESSGPVLWATERDRGDHFRVPAPQEVEHEATTIEHDTWTLTLNPGWRIRKTNAKGDCRVEKVE